LPPRVNGSASTIKDEVVPLFPNLPGTNDEEFHEEGARELPFSLHHHLKVALSKIPLNADVLPTSLIKRATEKEVEGSFLSIAIAEHTIVVIHFEFMFFFSF
jgi:hypothetical protein